jgi:2-dehydro-3-deoxyphosphogluconate aldolase / (4S)-4-hydroxy-2-oxoglutarate aldolase
MLATGQTVIAGCLTPTEILTATHAGAHAIKIFPANTVTPDYLAALHGPFPQLQLIPTGGITPDDAPVWLDAGAVAVGIGGQLSRPVRTNMDHEALVAATRAAMRAATRAAMRAATELNQSADSPSASQRRR